MLRFLVERAEFNGISVVGVAAESLVTQARTDVIGA